MNDDDIPSDVDLNDPYFRDALKDTDEENESTSMANFKSVQAVILSAHVPDYLNHCLYCLPMAFMQFR